jgi:hypothetical protein
VTSSARTFQQLACTGREQCLGDTLADRFRTLGKPRVFGGHARRAVWWQYHAA